MSCSTREFGKCVKTQLQLVCSNYDSREFISISLLIKRDFLIWINTAHKGVFERLEAGLCRERCPRAAGGTAGLEQLWGPAPSQELLVQGQGWESSQAGASDCARSAVGSRSLVDGSGQALPLKITKPATSPKLKKPWKEPHLMLQ